ncbi:superoxide dismutase [Streptomyces sp. TRM 70361]|uniref:SMP-30/gluconolactonase/LRE family protein n=1 Tax=Streptomyces sp. TRM 70361 TaxID=3116553 RepID=UPI002E7B83E7|nr:superoxide dismutase [Streptomyces sp. TRM 70361]MEE1938262.1 superoxide dismutase [Streptomyces sp. TRM 70361]
MSKSVASVVTPLLALLITAGLPASPAGAAQPLPAAESARSFPSVLNLPNGFSPEGIAIDRQVAYTGSLANGAIRRIDLKTGVSTQLAPPPGPGRIAVGMDVDRFGRLWVAGGGHGGPFPGVVSSFRVYDTKTGRKLADVDVPNANFINDVKLTRDAAWFTDSANPAGALIRVTIERDGEFGAPQKVALGGDWTPGGLINANGIEATPDGKGLIVGQTMAAGGGAALYVLPADSKGTANARQIRLKGDLESADGLVRIGQSLYVVTHHGVVKVKLSTDQAAGQVLSTTEVPGAAFASTADRFGPRLYVVDANLGDDLSNVGNPAAAFKVVGIRLP